MTTPRSLFAVWRWPRSRVGFLLIGFLCADLVFAAYLRLLAGTAIHVKIAESRLTKTVRKVPTYYGANSSSAMAISINFTAPGNSRLARRRIFNMLPDSTPAAPIPFRRLVLMSWRLARKPVVKKRWAYVGLKETVFVSRSVWHRRT